MKPTARKYSRLPGSGYPLALPVALLIALIAIGQGCLDFFTPAMGDDLGKWNYLGLDEYRHPGKSTLSFLACQYFSINGRVLDALGPATINLLPHIFASIVMGCMTGLYFWGMCRCARLGAKGTATAACLLLAVTLYTMPWWDYMWLRVCQFNYLWATAFDLLFITTFHSTVNARGWRLVSCIALGILSGCCHEALGVSMSAAATVAVIVARYRGVKLSKTQKILILALFAGTLVTIATPAFLHRTATAATDGNISELVITTLPVTTLLLIITIAFTATVQGRKKLLTLTSSPWLMCTVAAFVSATIALYSTIPGRTGWQAESLSIVAIIYMIPKRFPIHRATAVTVISISVVLIAAHYTVAIPWQKKMGDEYYMAIEEYKNSKNGIFPFDYTGRKEVPPLALDRVKGVPDADDLFLRDVIVAAYSHDSKPFIPVNSRAIELDNLPPDITLLTDFAGDTIMTASLSGSQMIITNATHGLGKTLYIAEPISIDPGDHWHPL